jgi:hypothetical protein
MDANLIIQPAENRLYERIRLLLYSADLPVQRLEADIEHFENLTASKSPLSHRRLVAVMPPLTLAAEEIVRVMVRLWGESLFAGGSANAGLRALVRVGPVKFAQIATMLAPDELVSERTLRLVTEFNRIFEHHPASGFPQARHVLAQIGLSDDRS